jgi:hypothetical protein
MLEADDMPQAVSRRRLIPEASFAKQRSVCTQSGTGQVSLPVLRCSLFFIIPPMLLTHLHLSSAHVRRRRRRKKKTKKKKQEEEKEKKKKKKTAVAQWLRYCATNRKVAGSIPDDVIGIFH